MPPRPAPAEVAEMSADLPPTLPVPLAPALRFQAHQLRANWGWFLLLGTLLIAAGAAAVALSVLATVLTVTAVGALALVGSGAEVASALWSRRWEGTALHLLTAVLYGVFGLLLVSRPVMAAEALTVLLAVVLLVSGVSRVTFAIAVRFHHWGWAVASGLVSVLLGVFIWSQLPDSGLWVIGTFVGIDLLMVGWTWVALAVGVRNLTEPPPAGA